MSTMKLQDIFDQLTTGEFSQLSIGGEDAGVISDKNYKQVVNHVNLGLAALFRRFPLKTSQLVVSLQPNMYNYLLTSDYAVANRRSRQPIRYILDSADQQFMDDILKIDQILTDGKVDLKVNDISDNYSVLTPRMNAIAVPNIIVDQPLDTPDSLKTAHLLVKYRANHPVLAVNFGLFNPDRIVIELPYSHMEALLYFVAARAQGPVGLNNEFNASVRYSQKYEAACQELERLNLRIDQISQENRFNRKGFV